MGSDLFILDSVSLGQKVRVLRLLRRLRQVDLADVAVCSQAEVSLLERDFRIHPGARQRIFSALGIEGEL